MLATKLMLALLAWLVLDLGCPFLGGAFVFEADGSVEVVRNQAMRGIDAPSAISTRPDIDAWRPECPRSAKLATRELPRTAHRTEPGRAHVLTAHPSSPAEDH